MEMIGRVEEGGNRWGSWVESVESVGDAVGEVEGRGRAKLEKLHVFWKGEPVDKGFNPLSIPVIEIEVGKGLEWKGFPNGAWQDRNQRKCFCDGQVFEGREFRENLSKLQKGEVVGNIKGGKMESGEREEVGN